MSDLPEMAKQAMAAPRGYRPTLGRIAYERYHQRLGRVLEYEDLMQEEREDWEATAQAVLAELKAMYKTGPGAKR